MGSHTRTRTHTHTQTLTVPLSRTSSLPISTTHIQTAAADRNLGCTGADHFLQRDPPSAYACSHGQTPGERGHVKCNLGRCQPWKRQPGREVAIGNAPLRGARVPSFCVRQSATRCTPAVHWRCRAVATGPHVCTPPRSCCNPVALRHCSMGVAVVQRSSSQADGARRDARRTCTSVRQRQRQHPSPHHYAESRTPFRGRERYSTACDGGSAVPACHSSTRVAPLYWLFSAAPPASRFGL